MATDNEGDDPAFSALTPSLRRRIDSAFDAVVNPNVSKPRKWRKLSQVPSAADGPGGFIVEDTQPGGFIVEDEPVTGGFTVEGVQPGGYLPEVGTTDEQPGSPTLDSSPTHIPLSLIPDALQLVDLQPDDEEVLSVFRNAASGWGSQAAGEEGVSRKDWRAVCAVLLEVHAVEEDEEGSSMAVDDRSSEALDLHNSDVEVESDEYRDDDDEPSGKDDSDEDYYEIMPNTSKKFKASKRKRREPTLSEDDSPPALTTRQKRECRQTFALFFPDVSDRDLDKQKIMIKDITRVAKLQKEKLKAEEIIEMLEVFSTSSDKSMNLPDFERMMIATKLA